MAPLFEHYGVQLWMPGVGGAGRLARRGPRADHARPGSVVQTGDHPDKDPGPHRDGYSDQGAGPVPGRAPALRIPARGCGSPPEQGARRVGPARAPPRTRPGHGAGCHVDVRAAAGRAQRGADHPGTERCWGAVPVGGRPGPQPAPHRRGVDAADRRRHPGQPPLHRAARVEPAADRLRPGRPGRHQPRAPAGAALEPARRLGHLEASRARRAGQRARLHRRPGRNCATRPRRAGGTPVPARRAPCLRDVRASS
jgi:hypothetical protein